MKEVLLFYVNMSDPRLTDEIQKYAVFGLLVKEYFNLEFTTFWRLAQLFIFNVGGELMSAMFHVANVSTAFANIVI